MGLFAAALAPRAHDPEAESLVASIRTSVEALEGLFAQLLDLSRLEAGALQPVPAAFPLQPLFARLAADFAPQATAGGLALRIVHTRLAVGHGSGVARAHPAQPRRECHPLYALRAGRAGRAPSRRRGAHRRDRFGHRHRRRRSRTRVRRIRAIGGGDAAPRGGPRHGARARDRAAARDTAGTPDRARLDTGPRLALLDYGASVDTIP